VAKSTESDVARMAYSVDEFCAMFNISRSTFYERRKAGAICTVNLGTRTLILDSEVRRFIASLA